MRKLAVKVLKDDGDEVLTVESVRLAMELFKVLYNHIKRALLDILPGQSGSDIYLKMKKIDPGVKALLNSGFRNDKQLTEAYKLGIKHFIEKPYTQENCPRPSKKPLVIHNRKDPFVFLVISLMKSICIKNSLPRGCIDLRLFSSRNTFFRFQGIFLYWLL